MKLILVGATGLVGREVLGGCRDLHIGYDDAARWIERQFSTC